MRCEGSEIRWRGRLRDMRAAVIEQLGETPHATQTTDPISDRGHVIAQVRAAALNPIDLSIANGRWYGEAPEPPYVPGSEGVGVLPDGRRVWFMAPANQGAFAEMCAIDADRAVELPEGLQDAVAACLGVAGLAGWLSVQWRAKVQPGETVLVLGASGPVGGFAIQAARLLGAGRIVAAARDRDGLRRAESLVADATVNIAEADDLTQALREASGGEGADVTIDPLWGAPAAAAVAASAQGGRFVQLGQSAGAEATLTSASVRGKMLSILGYSNFDVPWEDRVAAYRSLAEHAVAGRLRVDYEIYPLERIAEAWKHQRQGAYRKLVLTPGVR
jgi:NADPH2:quinone reductase